MILVFIYGPPAAGKLTVARELADLTGFRLFHNHLTVNLVSSVFPFLSEPWVRLLNKVRGEVFAEAAREGVDLIFTNVWRGRPEHAEVVRGWLRGVESHGGKTAFVQLGCEREELLRRVQDESRISYGKITDPKLLEEIMAESDLFGTLPFEPTLRIDTTALAPKEAAAQIAAYYKLV